MCLFITVLLVISWFIKIDLKQFYCSYLRTQIIQKVSVISVIFFEVNVVAEQKPI